MCTRRTCVVKLKPHMRELRDACRALLDEKLHVTLHGRNNIGGVDHYCNQFSPNSSWHMSHIICTVCNFLLIEADTHRMNIRIGGGYRTLIYSIRLLVRAWISYSYNWSTRLKDTSKCIDAPVPNKLIVVSHMPARVLASCCGSGGLDLLTSSQPGRATRLLRFSFFFLHNSFPK